MHTDTQAQAPAAQASAARALRLKAASHATHERLDQRIMASQPFVHVGNYLKFLHVQHRFHHDISALYRHSLLQALVPDLSARQRLQALEQDLRDLGAEPERLGAPALDAGLDLATAMGWLYVAEGSNLGGAVLFKLAGRLGLDEHHGARHLAAHPDGVLRHWRQFTDVLELLPLNTVEEERLFAGARAAFQRVHQHVDAVFAG
ncbi:biliverdin-producing heme oxygenase [Roseateles sp. BYS180W]|uniref:Biliverdin-producing heme oxygenase n=1 Tax=Roseateles rivi TaxID=3299028 RepID=A0ABW7FTI7_9BURK